MKIFKRILFFLLFVVAAALVVALFVSKDFNVEKEITINKPKQQVFDYVKYLKNQSNYSVWAKMDPNMKSTFTGTDGTVGFVNSWDGNKDVGTGSQTITAITEGQSLETDLKFIKPWESTAKAYMTTSAVNDSTTKVIWGFKSKMAYPMNITKLFMNMDKMVGDDYQNGLNNLKAVLEK
jgi:Polyketide cyclase / dehydrase and lipid transport